MNPYFYCLFLKKNAFVNIVAVVIMISVRVTAAEVGAAEQMSDGLNYINEVLDVVDTYPLFIAIENAQYCKVSLIE